MSFVSTFAESISYGVITFAVGLFPLHITSQSLLWALTTFGTGRLISSGLAMVFTNLSLGAASALSYGPVESLMFSPITGALAHVAGILFLLVVERRISSRRADATDPHVPNTSNALLSQSGESLDSTELRELGQSEAAADQSLSVSRTTSAIGPHQRRVYLFTVAFVLQQLMNGIHIGFLAARRHPMLPLDGDGRPIPSLSPIAVYLLDLCEKLPTVLAFTTTLLSASLPTAECKRYLLAFAAAPSLAGILSYAMLTIFQISPTQPGNLPFLSITSFLGGMFVYAALIIRALIANSPTGTRRGLFKTALLMLAGALAPWLVHALVIAWIFRSMKSAEL